MGPPPPGPPPSPVFSPARPLCWLGRGATPPPPPAPRERDTLRDLVDLLEERPQLLARLGDDERLVDPHAVSLGLRASVMARQTCSGVSGRLVRRTPRSA